ncbi:MAG: hypothetical protein U0822_23195 [Anaerolineae bacterium]
MWRLNPQGREALAGLGVWATALFAGVSILCACCALGLWTGRRWGYILALAVLIVNIASDVVSAFMGMQLRAVVGIPIVALIVAYLFTRRVRHFFSR